MMKRHAPGRLSIASVWGLGLLCAGGLAVCAEPDDAGIPEIVVTAQKYESTIQNTPFSISALSGEHAGGGRHHQR